MYSYTFDSETNGILLNANPTTISLEARPVFAQELDMLGLGGRWKYDRLCETPFMWAESVNYFYRGRKVMKLKGGSLYVPPEIEFLKNEQNGLDILPEGETLVSADLDEMCRKNRIIANVVEDAAIKGIQRIYEKYKDRLDIFEVAYSGGKDSRVLLDLVHKALPPKTFVAIFGDTGMEFPDTYDHITAIQKWCGENGIPFHVAKSHFDPEESWRIFGPPARRLRWCCSVHKSAPQTLKMREILGKRDYVGLDFTGVRRHESIARSEYEQENFSKKQRGQHSFHAILEWTSAEVWNHIFTHALDFNRAYRKGNSRAGCLVCPMSGGIGDWIRRECYPEQVDRFVSVIKEKCVIDDDDKKSPVKYFADNSWAARCSGKTIIGNENRFSETIEGGRTVFEMRGSPVMLRQWLKPLGGIGFAYHVDAEEERTIVSVTTSDLKSNPSKAKFFKYALHKAAYCVGCRVCEQNCPVGCIFFSGNMVNIDETKCRHCMNCFDLQGGCLMYDSRFESVGEARSKGIDCFNSHAIKEEWLISYFDARENFMKENLLGNKMLQYFRVFLKDSGLAEPRTYFFSSFASFVCDIGWNSKTALALMLLNLCYRNRQFEWMAADMDIDRVYSRSEIDEMLALRGVSERSRGFILQSLKRISDTSFGKSLGFMRIADSKGKSAERFVRSKCNILDARVVLYAIMLFAEKCEINEFSLFYLYDDSVERAGVSPARILGIERDGMQDILQNLSNNGETSGFVYVSFTLGLDKIVVRRKDEEARRDLLELIRKDMGGNAS